MSPTVQTFEGTILLVEDSEIISLDTADMLLDLGFREVLVARTGAEALAQLAARGAELRAVVLDLDLNGESALPVAEAAVRLGAPVVVASGHSEGGKHPALASAPILRKPYAEADMRLALAAALAAPRAVDSAAPDVAAPE